MTILRKKILCFKIQKIITKNNFVLFFQHNNIKNKQWIYLKNLFLNYKHIEMLVCKNKLSSAIVFNSFVDTLDYTINNIKLVQEKKQTLLHFLCQGPTVIIACNSINECKSICQILNIFKHSISAEHKFSSRAISFMHSIKVLPTSFYTNSNIENSNVVTQFNEKLKQTQESKHLKKIFLKPFLLNQEFPAIFKNKKKYLDLRCDSLSSNKIPFLKNFGLPTLGLAVKQSTETSRRSTYNLLEKSLENKTSNLYLESVKPGFFFIGGYIQNQFVDFVDLKKICKTNKLIYSHLIQEIYKPIQLLRTLPCFVNMNFLNTLKVNENLITVLQIRKNSL